jgi:hypothetical protein
MRKTERAVLAGVCILLVSGCGSKSSSPTSPSPPGTTLPAVAAALETLSTKAIYFGHQSVGFNIMDGVQTLISANAGQSPRLEQTSAATSMRRGVFAHAANGSNGDPAGKTAAFQATLQQGVGAAVDIAFFKFCYVDFEASTDVAALFADYRSKMAALRSAYPNLRLVYFTAPLTTGASRENAVREQFNDLVRQAYGATEAVFDLAKVESTRPDGSVERFDGVRALVASYSSDGGHLNATGEDVVSKALVVYLASL